MAEKMKLGKFCIWVAASLIFRLVLIYFPNNLNLASAPKFPPLSPVFVAVVSLSVASKLMQDLCTTVLLCYSLFLGHSQSKAILPSRDIAALIYLWNPFTIVACVGLSRSLIENMAIILSLYGACTCKELMVCLRTI